MKIEVEKAHSPEWANPEKTAINLMVKFSHLGEEVPFTASLSDSTKYGSALFNQAKAGKLGKVAVYSGPTAEEMAMAAFQHSKAKIASTIEAHIAPLERAKQLGVATAEELAELERLERYSVYLMRAKGPELIALSDM